MSDAKELQKESLEKFQKYLLEEFCKEDTGIIWWCRHGGKGITRRVTKNVG